MTNLERKTRNIRRELNRLELSLKSALGLSDGKSIVVAMHYPPFNPAGEPAGFVEIMRKYNVKICIYGHLHGNSSKVPLQA